MSQTNKRLKLDQASLLAERIKEEIRAYCERVKIVGSIRRCAPTIGDIEIMVIPKRQPSLVDDIPGESLLDPVLRGLVEQSRLIRANKGKVLKKYYIPHLYQQGIMTILEIIISSPERWPVEVAIKTGPREFSYKLVTPRNQGGYLPSDCLIDLGWRVWRGDARIPLETEEDFIKFCCGRWIEPEDR